MSAYSKEQQKFYLSNIRQLMAIDPDMSIREMQNQLGQNGIELDRAYLTKLVKKHLTAQSHRIDRKSQAKALAHIEDVLVNTLHALWPIVLSKTSTNKEKLGAAAEIHKTHFELFKLYQSVGIFDKKLGEIDLNITNSEVDPTIEALVADIRSLWTVPNERIEAVVRDNQKDEHGTDNQPKPATKAPILLLGPAQNHS